MMKFPFLQKDGLAETEDRIAKLDKQLKNAIALDEALKSPGGTILGDIMTDMYNGAIQNIGHDQTEKREQSRYMIIAINEIKRRIDVFLSTKQQLTKELEKLVAYRNRLRQKSA